MHRLPVRWRFVEKHLPYHGSTPQFATEFTSVRLKAAAPECRSKTKHGVHLGVRIQDCICLLPSLQSTEKGALNDTFKYYQQITACNRNAIPLQLSPSA